MVFTLWSGLDYLWRFRYLISPFDTSRVRVPSGAAPEHSPAQEVGEVLRASGLTLSVAESITGGMIGSMITDQPGSSAYFVGGVIAYSNDVKRDQLGVPAELFETVGAVSAEVAVAMAKGVQARLGTSLAVAATGIAGPGGDATEKAVGLTYIAVVSGVHVFWRQFTFKGDRASVRRQTAIEAMRMLVLEARNYGQAKVRPA